MTELIHPEETSLKNLLGPVLTGSRELLFCTDFDGTLVHFTGVPSETELPEKTAKLLNQLAALKDLHLAVISGRGFDELTKLVPLENVTLAGNHGLKIRLQDGRVRKPETGEKIRGTIKKINAEVREAFGGLEGIIIENKGFGLALHYRQYEGETETVKQKFYEIWNRHKITLLEVIQGAKLVEIRPAEWNKGDAVDLLRRKWDNPPTIYIGDDTTDEDAFAVLEKVENGFPILVGEEENPDTRAQYRLENPGAVNDFLSALHDYLGQ
jgi:trehalose-phosphatase